MSDTFAKTVEAINAKDHRIVMLERRIAELTTGTRLSENQVGQLLEDIEYIIGHCRDQTWWRLNKIREAAERIEFIFVPPLETNGTPAASDAKGKDGQQDAE